MTNTPTQTSEAQVITTIAAHMLGGVYFADVPSDAMIGKIKANPHQTNQSKRVVVMSAVKI